MRFCRGFLSISPFGQNLPLLPLICPKSCQHNGNTTRPPDFSSAVRPRFDADRRPPPAPTSRRAGEKPPGNRILEPAAAAQNGDCSTGILRPLPHPAKHPPPATRRRSRRLSEVRRPTPPAVGGLRPPLCAEGALLGAGGEPRTRQPHPAVGSPPPGLRAYGSPPPARRRRRLPAVAGLASPASTAPATPRRRRSCSPAVRSVTTSLTLPPPFRFSPRTPLSPPTAIRPQSWPD